MDRFLHDHSSRADWLNAAIMWAAGFRRQLQFLSSKWQRRKSKNSGLSAFVLTKAWILNVVLLQWLGLISLDFYFFYVYLVSVFDTLSLRQSMSSSKCALVFYVCLVNVSVLRSMSFQWFVNAATISPTVVRRDSPSAKWRMLLFQTRSIYINLTLWCLVSASPFHSIFYAFCDCVRCARAFAYVLCFKIFRSETLSAFRGLQFHVYIPFAC